MTSDLSCDDGPIVELGPGTGVFTSAILNRGVMASQVAVFELGENFVQQLSKQYPQALIVHGDATSIAHRLPFPLGSVQAVICGLPLVSMPAYKVFRIVASSFQCLKEGGEFRLFTYGHRCPISKDILERLNLTTHRSALVLRNFPPAPAYILMTR